MVVATNSNEGMFQGIAKEYVGCDVVQSDHNKVDVLCEATKIPMQDDSFDTVFSTQVIEHVEDHRALIQEAHRLLKPGGALYSIRAYVLAFA